MQKLSAIVRNVCRTVGAKDRAPSFEITTTPDKTQQEALTLLETLAL
jgi:hypothetical protein